MKKYISKIIIITVSLLLSNCKKEVTGPKGDKGEKGDKGSSNSIITNTYTVNSWVWDNSSKMRTDAIFTNQISQNILDNGAIMVYENFGGSWIALPETFVVSQNVTYHVVFSCSLNTIALEKFLSDESDPGSNSSVFKVVIIPLCMIKPNVNINNYSEVKETYGLSE